MDEFLRLEIKYMFVTSYPQLCGFHMQLHSTFGHHYERDNLKSFVPQKKKKKKLSFYQNHANGGIQLKTKYQ